jgi:signal transduction histidine kinase
MHQERRWSGQSRKLIALLLAVTVPPAATLIWLGVQLLQQDRSLIAQREMERRSAVAQTIVHSLERSLAAAESWLGAGPVPAGMVRFTFSSRGVAASPADRVLWVTAAAALPAAEDRHFAEAERFEFQGVPDRALVVYEAAARSAVPTVRAGGLLRLARVRRQREQWDDALRAYTQLVAITGVAIAGAPADLQARRAICSVLADARRGHDLEREAASLEADLLSGRWLLDHSAWELTVSDLQRWTGRAVPISADRRLFSRVGELLQQNRGRDSILASPGSNRGVIVADGTGITVLSRADEQQTTVLALSPAVLSAWITDAAGPAADRAARVALVAASGHVLAGAPASEPGGAIKVSAADTTLPWTVVVSADRMSPLGRELAARRRLLLLGLAAILLLLGGGSYVLWRVLQRDLAVARLQTDFVAAVSHEFRTPLTSLRHVTELLEESDDLPPGRRRMFYQALGRSTERLHRLVESLLDFSRMEGGRKPYDLRALDAGALVAQVAADFERDVTGRGCRVTVHAQKVNARIRADAEALTHALWNLLDNAVKYSPDSHAIDVTVEEHASGVAISVCDRGLGIPAHEREAIFQRFVRGEQATRLGIKGTGLGLAMVSHIVEAHGGALAVESEEGAGSTFTIVLPIDSLTPLDGESEAPATTDFAGSESRVR